jgi:multiple sugar transport system substrate-binding protein
MFEMEQAIGNELNRAFVGQIQPQEALDNAAEAVRRIMDRNGFYGSRPPVAYSEVAPGLYVGEGKPLPA